MYLVQIPDQYDATKEWSLSDTSKGARSIKEIQETSKQGSRGKKYNVKYCYFLQSPWIMLL
jgi:hypothetical protein